MTIYTQLLTRMQASVCKRCLCRHALSVRLSVYPSVTFVYSVETNKHVFNFCFTIGYPHHSSFSASNVMAIFRLDPTPTPITGTSKKSNAGKVGQARSQPSDNGGRFISQILDLVRGSKIGVPSGCLGKTSIFKIISIDDDTLWSTLEST